MKRAQKRNLPPPKIQVINLSDEESTTHEEDPPEKKAVKKEPVLPSSSSASLRPPAQSSDVTKLEEQVRILEKKYQRACRAAREEQLRAERAEKLLDTKREVYDGYEFGNDTEKRLAEQTAQLVEAQRIANMSRARELKLAKENDSLMADLAEWKNAAATPKEKLAQENTSLKKEVLDLKEREDNFIRMKREAHERVEELRNQWDAMEEQLKLAGHHINELDRENFALKQNLDGLYGQREIQCNNEQLMAQKIGALEDELKKMKEKEDYENMLKHNAQQQAFAFQTKINELNGKLKEANTLESNLRHENAAIRSQLEDVRKKREDVKRASLELAQQTFKVKTELTELDGETNCMKGDLVRENTSLKKELEGLKEREDQTHKMNYNLTKTNADIIQELQCAREKESRVSSELGESVYKISILEAKIAELTRSAEMKERELNREIESLKQDVNDGRRSDDRYNNDDREKSHKIESLVKDITELRQKLLTANTKVIELNRTIKELNKELESMNESKKIAAEIANKSISKLNREIFVLKEQLEIMKKNENNANNCNREMAQKSASAEAEINELKGAMNIEKNRANGLIHEIGVLKGELDAVRKEGEDIKRSNLELSRDNDSLKEAQKMNFSLVLRNSALTQDLEAAKKREESMLAEHTHASAVLNYQLEQAKFREQVATNMNRRLTKENVQLEKKEKKEK